MKLIVRCLPISVFAISGGSGGSPTPAVTRDAIEVQTLAARPLGGGEAAAGCATAVGIHDR
jgi:hypothetical protein